MSYLIAVIDESMRTNSYLMCATVASTSDVVHLRQALRVLLLPNQRRLHAHTEKDGRKRMLLKTITELDGFVCHLVIAKRRKTGRNSCLKALVRLLLEVGVKEILIERVDHGTSRLDKEFMDALMRQNAESFGWRHEAPEHEPLLWISDAIASAYGAGGEWRRAVEQRLASTAILEND